MTEAEALLDIYDDLAVEIVDDAAKNTDADLPYSNRELAENICRSMDWEDFDLLGKFEFEKIAAEAPSPVVLAHAFISFLRWRLFRLASARGIGDEAFNQSCTAYSEYWYITLVRRWNELEGGPVQKPWIN